jgi:hypothetical protein
MGLKGGCSSKSRRRLQSWKPRHHRKPPKDISALSSHVHLLIWKCCKCSYQAGLINLILYCPENSCHHQRCDGCPLLRARFRSVTGRRESSCKGASHSLPSEIINIPGNYPQQSEIATMGEHDYSFPKLDLDEDWNPTDLANPSVENPASHTAF